MSVGYAFLVALGVVLGVGGIVFIIFDVVRGTAPSRRLLVGAVLVVFAAVLLSVAPRLA